MRPAVALLIFLIPECLALAKDENRARKIQVLSQQVPAYQRDAVPKQKQHHSDSCKGLLPWTCFCHPEVMDETKGLNALKVELISCSNSRLSHADTLASIQTFPNAQSATFYGNNFKYLPERFSGPGQHKSLLYLNLSANNFLHLHHDSLIGVPSLQSLDLSENKIQLRQDANDWTFLRPVRFLRRLVLRRTFRRPPENITAQLTLLENGLRHAGLKDLQFLDLSHNAFDHFPAKLICWTPSLTHLILVHNRLRTLRFDDDCAIDELKVIDLRSNRFVAFTSSFAKMASRLPPASVQVNENPFDCTGKTCASWHSMLWFRSTSVIRDKERVRCRSSEDDHEKLSDYLLYAPIDDLLQCNGFGSESSVVREEIGSDKINQAPRKFVDSGEYENGNHTDSSDAAVTRAKVSLLCVVCAYIAIGIL